MWSRLEQIEQQLESGDIVGGATNLWLIIERPESFDSFAFEAVDEAGFRENIGMLMSLISALWLLSEAVARPVFTEILKTRYEPLLTPPYCNLPKEPRHLNVFLAVLSTLDTMLNENSEQFLDGSGGPSVSAIQAKIVDAYLALRPAAPAAAVWADFVLVPLIISGHTTEARAVERAHPKLHCLPKGTAIHKLVSALYLLE